MNRDGSNIEHMVYEYGDSLLRACVVYLRDPALAEDAVQETYLRAYVNYANFRGECAEKTWLTAIAINVCRSMLRNPWRKRVALTSAIAEIAGKYDMPDTTVTEAVLRLPAKLREAVTLHYIQGMKLREIASALDMPIQTVASRLNRARKILRGELKEWYFNE